MRLLRFVLVCSLVLAAASHAQNLRYDVVVVGATPGGIAAAVAAARAGNTVGVFEQSAHIGGVVAGGLTATYYGDRRTIGGISREFFTRVAKHYREEYGSGSPEARACNEGYWFEPHVAELTFRAMLDESGKVEVFTRHSFLQLAREGKRITSIRFRNDETQASVEVAGDFFIDAQYEGDVLAHAGERYRIGSEAEHEFGEDHAGNYDLAVQAYNYRLCLTDDPENQTPIAKPEGYDREQYTSIQRFLEASPGATFAHHSVSMVRMPNGKTDTNAGVSPQTTDYPGANHDYPGETHGGRREIADAHRRYILGFIYYLQNDPDVPEIAREDARRWGLAKDEFVDNGNWPYQLYVRECRRLIGLHTFTEQDAATNRFSEASIGLGSYWIDSHPTDARVMPDGTQRNSGEVFIRIKPYEIPFGVVVPRETENLLVAVCVSATHIGYCTLRMEPVYMILGHACGEVAAMAREAGTAVQDVNVAALQERLLAAGQKLRVNRAPVAAFRVPGEQPIDAGTPVQVEDLSTDADDAIVAWRWDFDGDGEVDSTEASPTYTFTHTREYAISLQVKDAHGDSSAVARQVVNVVGGPPGVPDLLMDDVDAERKGPWHESASNPPFVGEYYLHDGNNEKGKASVRYAFEVTTPGLYEVGISFPSYTNRATNVPVKVAHADGEVVVIVNQQVRPETPPFTVIGQYRFAADAPATVDISNAATDGHVIADGVRLRWVEE